MNVRHVCKWCVVMQLVALGLSFGLNKALSCKAGPGGCGKKGVQVLMRGPVHEAFAEAVTYDPEPGIVVPKCRGLPSRNCRQNRDQREPTLPGSPAIGAGMTNGAISFGSAASGAPCRLAANGCPGIGARPVKDFSGLPDIGPMRRRARWNTCPSRLRPSKLVPTLPHPLG